MWSPHDNRADSSLSLSLLSPLLILFFVVVVCVVMQPSIVLYVYTHNIEMFLYLSCVLVHVYLTNRVVYALFVEWVLVHLSNSSGHRVVLM